MWTKPKIKHGKPTKYGWTVLYPENLELGHHSDIGCGTVINAKYNVIIGVGAKIGPNCSIMSDDTITPSKGWVVIGDRACVGGNSFVMPGVKIGTGAIVGACSFVNKNIPDFETWCGSPVKPMYKKGELVGGLGCWFDDEHWEWANV